MGKDHFVRLCGPSRSTNFTENERIMQNCMLIPSFVVIWLSVSVDYCADICWSRAVKSIHSQCTFAPVIVWLDIIQEEHCRKCGLYPISNPCISSSCQLPALPSPTSLQRECKPQSCQCHGLSKHHHHSPSSLSWLPSIFPPVIFPPGGTLS